MRILAFGDTHGMHHRLNIDKYQDIDMLIFSGDYSGASSFLETVGFVGWMSNLKTKYKVLVPGNHDYDIEYTECEFAFINDHREFSGLTVFGSPYTPEFMNWNYMKTESEMRLMYLSFPDKVDILVTHGPPYGILDKCRGEHLGNKTLRQYVDRVKPKVHIFGHIHEGYGHEKIGETMFCNVSICNGVYEPLNPVTKIYVEDESLW